MKDSEKKNENRKKYNESITFPIPFSKIEIKENIITKVNKDNTLSTKKLLNKALIAQSEGYDLKAKKYYQYLIDRGINDPIILTNYGIILKNNGQIEEAELSIRKAIRMNPNLAEAHNNLGNILSSLGNHHEAEESIRKGINLKPDSAEAHFNLAKVIKDLGNENECERLIRKAIKLRPEFALAHLELGSILNMKGKYQEAFENC